MKFSCHCRQVCIEIQRKPDFIHQCNCSLCSKSGARWGYFNPSEVTLAGITKGYVRSDKNTPGAEIRFCENCGVTTHFTLTESAQSEFGNMVVGVNMWLAGEHNLTGIELRFPDGRAWSGEGEFDYVRNARVI